MCYTYYIGVKYLCIKVKSPDHPMEDSNNF